MNKVIQNLANKSNLFVDLNGSPYPKALTAEEAVAAYEKFASLIVGECMAVSNAQRDPQNLNYKPSRTFAEAIWHHFGAE